MSTITDSLSSVLAGIHLPESIHSITTEDFDAIRSLIYREAGISLNDSKKALVASRLAKRLMQLNLSNHAEYLEYLDTRDPDGVEFQRMVNCLTTNKTDFFREPHHFVFLREVVFPRLEKLAQQGKPRKIRIWCSACSTGEEPYSTAMTVLEHFGLHHGWDVKILASDINTEVLDKAALGVYALERIEGLDDRLRRKYFLRGTGHMEGYCQVRSEVQRLVHFEQINLMDEHWPIRDRFDVIFCRNVIIYFNADTQRKLLPRLVHRLTDHGHIILGHSENLHWLTDMLAPLGNTVYQRKPSGRSASTLETIGGARLEVPKHTRANAPLPPSALPSSNGSRIFHGHRRNIVAGEYHASREPMVISTLLGSCVGACLFDPAAGVGGMTHFMLPYQASDSLKSARYGIHAMEMLINEMMKLGGDRRRIRAKVFGGASVLTFTHWPWDVGRRNVEFIRNFLETDGIPIVAERLGGSKPLRVFFLTNTGKAFVKEVRPRKSIETCELQLLAREKQELEKTSDDIVLF
jgi:chemotaxis protein methyltransferase CheR